MPEGGIRLAIRPYELMLIHRPELTEADVRSHVDEIEKLIAQDGTHVSTDFWGMRRFAYEIDHLREGYYSVVRFGGEHAIVSHLDRTLGLLDTVVRHKIFKRERND